MNLDDLIIKPRSNYRSAFFGSDSIDKCKDKSWFLQYPHEVCYQFNSQGFRDNEWPADLKKAIWCVGDSATMGVGSPIEHTWPCVLKKETNTNTINISLDGASNHWIARKALRILRDVSPDMMVIQWSFMHRRESSIIAATKEIWPMFYNNIKDSSWPAAASFDDYYALSADIQEEIKTTHGFAVSDLDRRIFADLSSTSTIDINETLRLMKKIERKKKNTIVIHCHVPDSEYNLIPYTDLIDVGEVEVLDLARDGYHYDIISSTNLVHKILRAAQ